MPFKLLVTAKVPSFVGAPAMVTLAILMLKPSAVVLPGIWSPPQALVIAVQLGAILKVIDVAFAGVTDTIRVIAATITTPHATLFIDSPCSCPVPMHTGTEDIPKQCMYNATRRPAEIKRLSHEIYLRLFYFLAYYVQAEAFAASPATRRESSL